MAVISNIARIDWEYTRHPWTEHSTIQDRLIVDSVNPTVRQSVDLACKGRTDGLPMRRMNHRSDNDFQAVPMRISFKTEVCVVMSLAFIPGALRAADNIISRGPQLATAMSVEIDSVFLIVTALPAD
jgi:hypothetical protein